MLRRYREHFAFEIAEYYNIRNGSNTSIERLFDWFSIRAVTEWIGTDLRSWLEFVHNAHEYDRRIVGDYPIARLRCI